jgi:hypothetical protein
MALTPTSHQQKLTKRSAVGYNALFHRIEIHQWQKSSFCILKILYSQPGQNPSKEMTFLEYSNK